MYSSYWKWCSSVLCQFSVDFTKQWDIVDELDWHKMTHIRQYHLLLQSVRISADFRLQFLHINIFGLSNICYSSLLSSAPHFTEINLLRATRYIICTCRNEWWNTTSKSWNNNQCKLVRFYCCEFFLTDNVLWRLFSRSLSLLKLFAIYLK